MSYACMLVDMLGLLAVYFGVGVFECAFVCLCVSVCQSVKTYFEKLLPWLEPAISWLDHHLQESSRVSNFQQLGFKELALNALAVVP